MRAWMSPIVRTASRISSAARTARSASSSCTTGIPNTATRASPITFSTVPPCRSTGPRIAASNRAITPRMTSGSNRSPSSVEPTTSQRSTVTVLRTSRAVPSAVGRGAAHAMQNRAASRFCWPHCLQVGINRV